MENTTFCLVFSFFILMNFVTASADYKMILTKSEIMNLANAIMTVLFLDFISEAKVQDNTRLMK